MQRTSARYVLLLARLIAELDAIDGQYRVDFVQAAWSHSSPDTDPQAKRTECAQPLSRRSWHRNDRQRQRWFCKQDYW